MYEYKNAAGTTYYLYAREVEQKTGGMQTIYFFLQEQQEGALEELPEGYIVSETAQGLPMIKEKDTQVTTRRLVR